MEPDPAIPIKSRACPTDGPIGVVVVLVAIALVAGLLFMLQAVEDLFSMFARVAGPAQQPTFFTPGNGSQGFPMAPTAPPGQEPGVFAVCLVLLLFAYLGLLFTCGVGICRGAAWSFHLGIVIFAIMALVGGGPAVLAGGMVVYCVLRLLGRIPPVPE